MQFIFQFIDHRRALSSDAAQNYSTSHHFALVMIFGCNLFQIHFCHRGKRKYRTMRISGKRDELRN